MPTKIIFILSLCCAIALQWGCRKEEVFDMNSSLEFSLDTLRFDTVFTELGSSTRFFKVYNNSDLSIKISNIQLANGSNSLFRLNVDGISGNTAQDVEINGNDSIYIFIEVTIDPDAPLSVSPYIVDDLVRFETNGNTQEVRLEAWGQNANYIPSRFSRGQFSFLSCDFGEVVWDDPKPYVIYGVLFVDSCTLTLPPGQKVYVHGGIARNGDLVFNDGLMIFLENGKLNVKGTSTDPVTIQGDRLEEEFRDISGQWSGIRFSVGSTGNLIEHAIIKNSVVGTFVDSAASLTINNSQIFNTSGPGIFGSHASIDVTNSLIHTNGTFSAQFSYGGNYSLTYCTLANFLNNNEALQLTNFRCADALCQSGIPNGLTCRVKNSIIYGSGSDEISMVDIFNGDEPDMFNYNFENCIVRTDELTDMENFPNFYDNCDPCENVQEFNAILFESIDERDFHLDSLSIAESMAAPIPGIPIDLEFNFRDVSAPDLGCYEYQE